MKGHVRLYRDVLAGKHSGVRSFEEERLQIFCVLKTAAADDRLAWLTSGEISDILCEVEGLNIPRQRVAAILTSADRQQVAKRKLQGKDHFRLMHAGEVELEARQPKAGAHFIDPERGFSAIRTFEDTLAGLGGALKVCDPHVENKTLDFLAACASAQSIDLLTVNVHKESTFRRDLTAFRQEHPVALNVRISANPKLHDRYILHDGGMLLLGGSLNGFAKKQSFVIAVGPDLRLVTETAFGNQWSKAAPFI